MTEALQQEIRTLRSLYQSDRDPDGRVFAPLADAYRRAERIPDALKLLREGLPRHPDFVTGHVVAAQLYVEQGLSEEGALAARRALELDEENVNALVALLTVLHGKGDVAEARSVRERLLEVDPAASADLPLDATAASAETTTLDTGWGAGESHGGELETFATSDAATVLDVPTPWAADHEGVSLDADFTIVPEEAPLDLSGFGADAGRTDDLPLDRGAWAPDEPTLNLRALTPDPEPVLELDEIRSDETLRVSMGGTEVALPDDLAPDPEPVFDLGAMAPAALQATGLVGALMPEVDVEAEPEPVLDMASLAPEAEAEQEPVLDMASLAPDVEAEPEPVLDMALLAPDVEAESEPVLDMASLAPEAEADPEPVLEMTSLAPEAEAEPEPVLDMTSLAPEAEADPEPVLDMTSLAPEAEAVPEPVLDMASLAPEAEPEPVLDMASLAPEDDGHEDQEPLFDMAMLAPEPAPDPAGETMTQEEPDDLVIDLDALRPVASSAEAEEDDAEDGDSASAEDSDVEAEDDGDGEVPLYTRTLAELYVKQGALDRALVVFRQLRAADPSDAGLARRIAELEGGAPEPIAAPTPVVAPTPVDEPEEEVESLARDLAHGGETGHDVESPFAWGEREPDESEPGPSVKDYFEQMLGWEPGDPK